MALWKRPFASGDVIIVNTDPPPADSPKMVTFPASPPKAAMFFCTHFSAAI